VGVPVLSAFKDHEASLPVKLPLCDASLKPWGAHPVADAPLSMRRTLADTEEDQVSEFLRKTSASTLVSCIMLTRERPDFALQAIRYFQRQDYLNTELIVVEEGAARLSPLLPRDPRVRLLRLPGPMSNCALMNLTYEEARGDIIIHWNDFDWYGSRRISRQISAIQAGVADASVLFDPVVFDPFYWQFGRWRSRPPQELLLEILASTLAFRRAVWQRLARYPGHWREPGVSFLKQMFRCGVRIKYIQADGILVRLNRPNGYQSVEHRAIATSHPVVEPALPAEDRAYYAKRSLAAPQAPVVPLVSCIMPTRDRRRFIERAIAYFTRQDYPSKELIIIDDGYDSIADLVAGCADVRYYNRHSRSVLGAKRNTACEFADGEFIVHMDDDDWYAPDHLSLLVGSLLKTGADIGGVRTLPFIDVDTGGAWLFEWPASKRIWAAGNSLGYRKDLWSRSRFPNLDKAEDTAFVWSAAVRSMCDVSDAGTIVGTIHAGNTVRKHVNGVHWRLMPIKQLECLLGNDFQFYQSIEGNAGSKRRTRTRN
jgi:glycosyltransferase involved in cell wall biosynthesis